MRSNQVEFIIAVRKKIDIPFDISLPNVLDDSFSLLKYNSFSRGYHLYKYTWEPTVGDGSLHFEEEKDNDYDKHAVAIIFDSFHSNKVVQHVPLCWSESANKFLKVLCHHIRVDVSGRRVNGDIDLGLEVQVDLKNPYTNLINAPMLKWKNV